MPAAAAAIQARPVGAMRYEEFQDKAREFHGYPAPGLLIGGYMVELGKGLLPAGTLFEVVVETPKCLPDAVQLLTLCTWGNGRIRLANTGRYALALYDKHSGEGVRVFVDPARLAAWPEISAWLLKAKSKHEQDSARLLEEIGQAGPDILGVEAVRVPARYLGKRSSGPVACCPGCGEPYLAATGPMCRGCLGEVPYVHSQRPLVDDGNGDFLRAVPVEEAVGRTALHDMTRIVPGESKGPAFLAGQAITAGDVCRLQQMGRTRVFVQEAVADAKGRVHENDAVLAFAERMAGEGVAYRTPPREGKIDFLPKRDGLLVLDRERLVAFNMVPNVMCATRQAEIFVEQGKPLAGARAIPLYLSRENFAQALAVLGQGPLFSVVPLRPLAVGILVTGTEVFNGLVEDRFIPVISGKVAQFGCPVLATDIVPDDRAAISGAVRRMLAAGAELIVTTAGLSVDPDDVTRLGLADAGLTDALYGAPILPGAMTLLGRIGQARVMGVPACGLFFKTTSFDLLLPRVLAGREITRRDLAEMADGSFCLGCDACTFPKCPFGR